MKKFLFLVLLVACSSSHKNLEGKYDKTIAIPEKSMIKILRDYHLAEGVNSAKGMRDLLEVSDKDTVRYLDSIIIHNGYNRARFDTTIKIYIKDLTYFSYIYDNVIKELSKMEGESSPKAPK